MCLHLVFLLTELTRSANLLLHLFERFYASLGFVCYLYYQVLMAHTTFMGVFFLHIKHVLVARHCGICNHNKRFIFVKCLMCVLSKNAKIYLTTCEEIHALFFFKGLLLETCSVFVEILYF